MTKGLSGLQDRRVFLTILCSSDKFIDCFPHKTKALTKLGVATTELGTSGWTGQWRDPLEMSIYCHRMNWFVGPLGLGVAWGKMWTLYSYQVVQSKSLESESSSVMGLCVKDGVLPLRRERNRQIEAVRD